MKRVEQVIEKIANLDEQLRERDKGKAFVKYDDFAYGYLKALQWVLSE